jgi:hypothetical protein
MLDSALLHDDLTRPAAGTRCWRSAALAVVLATTVGGAAATATGDGSPTFHRDIEPLLQRHCQECHREGGGAPFALVEWGDVEGLAPTIGEVVARRLMPPWHADRSIGRFANDRSLPDAALRTIAAWVEAGAPRGDPAAAPKRREWPKAWSLAEPPDLVVATPPFAVPAEGTLLYHYVRLRTGLAADRFVRAAEVRNSGAEAVHHVLAFLDSPRGANGPWRPGFNQLELMQGAKPKEVVEYTRRFKELIQRDLQYGEAGGLNGYFLSGLSGGGAVEYRGDEGKFLPAGAEFVLQLHYQPVGRVLESTTTLALWFADAPRPRALDTRGVATVAFVIPPGAPDHEVRAEYRLPAAATLVSLQPHMHLRGKSFTYVLVDPDGREEILLHVPSYDFDWQHEYVLAERREIAEGSVLRVIAHFDNSADNPSNPDPTQPVYFGLQTHEEMLIGYFEVIWRPEE